MLFPGVLHYNSTPTDMRPDEAGDEYDEDLQKKKLEIETDIEQYVKVRLNRSMKGTCKLSKA